METTYDFDGAMRCIEDELGARRASKMAAVDKSCDCDGKCRYDLHPNDCATLHAVRAGRSPSDEALTDLTQRGLYAPPHDHIYAGERGLPRAA